MKSRLLASANEAIALAAVDSGAALGVGYPGTPSSEILEEFAAYGGEAEWAPNEKTALEVAIGAAFAGARALVTMKHVGLNVAADPLFTVACCNVAGGLVILCADDPGMASSQNEQDNRNYARAAGVPMLEPSNSQEAYDFCRRAFEIAGKYHCPVLLRVTTRVCHSKCVLERRPAADAPKTGFVRDLPGRVMIPAYARPAHRRMRARLAEIARVSEEQGEFIREYPGSGALGIIASGIAVQHAREAAPDAAVLALGLSWPLPLERMRAFAAKFKRCVVVEEGDPLLFRDARAAGIPVEGKAEMYRFGELSVGRVKRLLANDLTPEEASKPGKPPQLCVGCPHRKSFEALHELGAIVSGDIGCYTLGVLAPYEAIDSCVCMGASITVGLGLRRVLPEAEARKVVSVLGDSTFWHTGINGIVEMVYNRPKTGHVVVVFDNSITAMTGCQENPSTGRKLNHEPAPKLSIEDTVRGMGVDCVEVIDSTAEYGKFVEILRRQLASNETAVIIARRPCILGLAKVKSLEAKKK